MNIIETVYELAERDARYVWAPVEVREPGYEGERIIVGYWWCGCDGDLHDWLETHHPDVHAALEDEGIVLEWEDEWIQDNDGNAWRCVPDSYRWQRSYVITDDGIIITIDQPGEWIEWATNNVDRAVPGSLDIAELYGAGFEPVEPVYWAYWGGSDSETPANADAEIRKFAGDVDIVFRLTEASQFYVRFEAWVREAGKDED